MFADFRFALRLLAKSPGFTAIAVLALALGISNATTMFTFYNAILLRPLPNIRDEDRLVMVRSYNPGLPGSDFNFSQPDFLDLRDQAKTLEGPFIVWNRTYMIGGTGTPERLLGTWISAVAFTTLGTEPVLGRNFRPDEDKDDAAPVAILSHALWQRRFGGSRSVIDQVVVLNGQPTTIVGVMPEGFRFPEASDLWQPFHYDTKENPRGNHSWDVYARMKAGVSLPQVQAELGTISAALSKTYVTTNEGKSFRALLIRDEATRDERLMLQLMLGAVMFVLLIACGNVANLLLARSATRAREIAVRAALGADRGRIIRQMLTESLLLGLLGGGLGVLFRSGASTSCSR